MANEPLPGPAGDRDRLELFFQRVAAALEDYLQHDLAEVRREALAVGASHRPDKEARLALLQNKYERLMGRLLHLQAAAGLPTPGKQIEDRGDLDGDQSRPGMAMRHILDAMSEQKKRLESPLDSSEP